MRFYLGGTKTKFAFPFPKGTRVALVGMGQTNTALFDKKHAWIDFNAGTLVDDWNMEKKTNEFFDYIISVASGEETCTEKHGIRDMAIFKDGVTL